MEGGGEELDLSLTALREAIKLFFCYGDSRQDAIDKIQASVEQVPEVKEFIDFVMSTKRGICPGRLLHKED